MKSKEARIEWMTVATVYQLQEAYMLKAMLEEEGILVFLKDEQGAQIYLNAIGGFKIQVPESEAEKACQFLAESGFVD